MKRVRKRLSESERSAWQRFEQTGEVGAYLLYRAIREAQGNMKR